jgi:hypothetical protein
MDEMNLSKWGTRVYWVCFAILLFAGGLATFPGRGRAVSVVGLILPWKWVFAAWFFAAMLLAYLVAMTFDHFTNRPTANAEPDTYQLDD